MARTNVSAASALLVIKQWHSSPDKICVRCSTAQNKGGCLLGVGSVESNVIKRQSINDV